MGSEGNRSATVVMGQMLLLKTEPGEGKKREKTNRCLNKRCGTFKDAAIKTWSKEAEGVCIVQRTGLLPHMKTWNQVEVLLRDELSTSRIKTESEPLLINFSYLYLPFDCKVWMT